jgi:ABC-type dipeptide/oligopeptide/nickel transport system ATPase subunit
MTRLAAIELSAFRGVRHERIDLRGASLFLYGENGHGKSSIVDALEFFFTGDISHLEGAEGLSTKKHAPHVRLDPDSLEVRLAFQGVAAELARRLKVEPTVPPHLKSLVQAAGASKFILHRQELLNFIMAQAAPRYQQLATLIGVDELEQIELAWKTRRDELADHAEALKSSIREAKSSLQGLCGTVEDFNDETLRIALNRRLEELGQTPLQNLSELETRKLAVSGSTAHKERAEAAAALNVVRAQAEGLSGAIGSLSQHKELWKSVEELTAEAGKLRQVLFTGMLEQARRLVRDYALEVCPVCEQPINGTEVTAQIDKRLLENAALTTKVDAINRQKRALSAELSVLQDKARQLSTVLLKHGDVKGHSSTFGAIATWAEGVRAKASKDVASLDLGSFGEFIDAQPITATMAACQEIGATLSASIAKLAPSTDEKKTVQIIDLLTRFLDSRQRFLARLREAIPVVRELDVVAYIYKTFIDTKQKEVQRVYDQLQADIERFYSAIHPNEPYGSVRLEVIAERRASAEIKMGFAGSSDQLPRAYNSEAHLDSLGLCVFLAFVKRFNAGVPYLVLDDVVSSIDSQHRSRICDLLFSEFKDYQLIITTHDALWFEELQAYQRARKFGPALFLKIVNWTIDDGPRLDRHKPRWEYISDRVKEGDKSGAASATRKALEWFLFEIACALQAQPVVRRDAKYDVGSLLTPVLKKVADLGLTWDDRKVVIPDFQANLIVGNLLTHNNPLAENASVAEVEAFYRCTRALHDLFFCEKCGSFVRYHREAKIVKCDCAKDGLQWPVE